MIQRNTYIGLPDIPAGYVLNPAKGFFSVIVPEATTNLITNPSVELATTNYTAVGSSIARSTTQQRRGAYSLAVTPTAAVGDGAYYGTVSLTSGTTYTFSVDFYGASGVPYKIYFATTGGVALQTYTFTAIGRWQRVKISYTETSTTTRRLYMTKNNSTSTAVFYVDGLQLETKAYNTTYCDGDQVGLVPNQVPAPFLWTGTAHASTSTRSIQTRAGGKVMNFDNYFFRVLAYTGLGMALVSNISIPNSLIDGSQYQRTIYPERTFAIAGQFEGADFSQLQRTMADFYDTLKRDAVAVQQPLVLRYQAHRCNDPIGDELEIQCVYNGGLEGATDNLHGERVTPQFSFYLPLVLGVGESGASLSVSQSLTNIGFIMQKSPTGTWSKMTNGLSDYPYSIVRGNDGTVYVGGRFTSTVDVIADTSYIVKWNGTAWSSMTGGDADDIVYKLIIGPDGSLYATGNFLNIGGIAANRIAKFNGATWSALGTGLDASGHALAFDTSGNLYVGGEFSAAGGIANTSRIAKWNGSAWSALGTGMNGDVLTLAVQQNGTTIYAGGSFTLAGGVASTVRVAKWNGNAWSPLGAGFNVTVEKLAFRADGTLFAGGSFTQTGSTAMTYVSKWNGVSWTALGSSLNNAVWSIAALQNGNMLFGGAFTTAGGLALPDPIAQWNGTAWTYGEHNSTSDANVYEIYESTDGTLYLGLNTSGNVTTSAITSVTNSGTAKTYPKLTIKGPSSGTSQIYQLFNYTTGAAIYFNYTINAGETAILDLTPNNIKFTSSAQGNILNRIIAGSNLDFFLQPGANSLSFFSSSSTVTATMTWRNQYNSVNDATY